MALKIMFDSFKQEFAKDGFANIISVANENAIIRDIFLEEMSDGAIELTNQSEEDLKNEMLDEEEMEALIDKIPETEIDQASVAAGKLAHQDVPVDPDEYIGAPLDEAMHEIYLYIPNTEEV